MGQLFKRSLANVYLNRVLRDVTKTGNGERGAGSGEWGVGNGERKSGNDLSAETSIKI